MFIHAMKATVSAGALQEEHSEVHTWVLNVRKSFSQAPLARRKHAIVRWANSREKRIECSMLDKFPSDIRSSLSWDE